MGKRLQPYLSCGRLDLLQCPFWYCRDFRGNGRMACSTVCGAFHAYADGIFAMQASETVQLFLKERQAGN